MGSGNFDTSWTQFNSRTAWANVLRYKICKTKCMFGCIVEMPESDFAFVRSDFSKNLGVWLFESKLILFPNPSLTRRKSSFCVKLKNLQQALY